MVSLDEIRNSLNSNSNLTDDIKDSFMELITIFKDRFPDVDLTNLNNRLKTLQVIKVSKFLVKNSSVYNPTSNEMLFNLANINDVDCKHVIMRELLNVISAKDNYTGFNKDHAYEALNIGYTEILTNFLVGNEGVSEYEDEMVEANLIAKLIGGDTFYQAYFNNNVDLILNAIG